MKHTESLAQAFRAIASDCCVRIGKQHTKGVALNAGSDELQGYVEALMAKLLKLLQSDNADTQQTAPGAVARDYC